MTIVGIGIAHLSAWDGEVTYDTYGVTVDIDSCDYAWNEDLGRCEGQDNLGWYTGRRALRGLAGGPLPEGQELLDIEQ